MIDKIKKNLTIITRLERISHFRLLKKSNYYLLLDKGEKLNKRIFILLLSALVINTYSVFARGYEKIKLLDFRIE
jgi:hypothetical protein